MIEERSSIEAGAGSLALLSRRETIFQTSKGRLRQLVSPRWRWPSLAVAVICLITVRLAFWQFDRLAQSAVSQESARTVSQRPPLALDATEVVRELRDANVAELSSYTLRRVSARGTYDHSRDEALTMQVHDGQLGVRLLTPLRLTGQVEAVLVDRGWLPIAYDRPVTWQPFQKDEQVTIEGRIRPGYRRRYGATPTDMPTDSLVADLDLDRIGASLPYPLLRVVLTQSPGPDAQFLPIRRELEATPNEVPHFFYAVQWIAITLIVGGGYVTLAFTSSNTRPVRMRVLPLQRNT